MRASWRAGGGRRRRARGHSARRTPACRRRRREGDRRGDGRAGPEDASAVPPSQSDTIPLVDPDEQESAEDEEEDDGRDARALGLEDPGEDPEEERPHEGDRLAGEREEAIELSLLLVRHETAEERSAGGL